MVHELMQHAQGSALRRAAGSEIESRIFASLFAARSGIAASGPGRAKPPRDAVPNVSGNVLIYPRICGQVPCRGRTNGIRERSRRARRIAAGTRSDHLHAQHPQPALDVAHRAEPACRQNAVQRDGPHPRSQRMHVAQPSPGARTHRHHPPPSRARDTAECRILAHREGHGPSQRDRSDRALGETWQARGKPARGSGSGGAGEAPGTMCTDEPNKVSCEFL